MRISINVLMAAILLLASSVVSVALHGSEIKYGPKSAYSGYFVRPTGNGPFPGLVMIHEWWGLNDNIKEMADRLAGEGYAALAVDLFGKSTTDPAEAMWLSRGINPSSALAQLLAAADYLRVLPYVPDDKVGSIGWCFGGRQSLNLALNDPKLAAAVIYYGQLVTDPKELAKIKAAVLGIFGEADESIPMDAVREFDKALTEAGVRHEIYTYPGAGHAFANPTQSQRYKPEAAADAWKKTIAFLAKYLKGLAFHRKG
ncbi:MAG: dienelactone hydrolase family protein [Armatimonadota bacterium]|nr:dienelactone hydrolase family protein [Armatimonadota bacterium]